MKTINLNGTWEFRSIAAHGNLIPRKHGVAGWMKASVPGTVHTDLLANGKIPDPFYRMQENEVQWVDSQEWVYRREFSVPPAVLEEQVVELVACGLDTIASIRCNGRKVGQTSNMFVEHRLDLKRCLHEGTNTLEIRFDSPVAKAKGLERKHGPLRVANEPHRVYIRKAQYSFGWDWGPRLTTSGIWRDIRIEAYSQARLRDPFVRVSALTKDEAVMKVSVDLDVAGSVPLILRTFVSGHGTTIEHRTPVKGKKVDFVLRIPRPHCWWPNGYGEQPMYSAHFSLLSDQGEINALEVPFAIRTVRLLQKKDAEGRSFIIEVNGVKIFCKGADWIPCDSFVPRIRNSTYETLLNLARDAHMNMIRVWGGGFYEQEVFYRLCDSLGLLVWQDFMFACGEYPEEPWFLASVASEAKSVIKRLRNHPSIALWCGNNECEWLFCTENPDKSPDDMSGARIFRDILQAACDENDGTRPYWRSSPFGRGFPNAESNGNHHQWHVWSAWKDYREYENDHARFVTEFGFQAPANRVTFEEVMISSDRHPQSKVMEHHNKQIEGTERLFRFLAAHYTLDGTFDDFVYKGQLVQAEALKCAVEHWRRRKFMSAGSLFWQLNDCWPVSSWAVVDSALRPKAGYFYAKRFFSPLLLSFKSDGGDVAVWLTNDRLESATGVLGLKIRSFSGKVALKIQKRIVAPANSSREVHRLSGKLLAGIERAECYLYAGLLIDGKLSGENRFFFEEPKHLRLPRPRVTVTVRKNGPGPCVAIVKADKFVKNLCLEVEGEDVVFDDNYFDLDAGGSKEIRFFSGLAVEELKKKITLRWV